MAINMLVSPEKFCRICLAESANLKSLFTNISNDKTLLEALCLIVNTDILIKNHLPDRICSDCESIIYKTEDFKRRCIESESILEQQTEINEISILFKKRTRKSKMKLEKLSINDEVVGVLPFLCSECFSIHPTLLSFTNHKIHCNGKNNKQHGVCENGFDTEVVKQGIKPSYDSNFYDDVPGEYKLLHDVKNELRDYETGFHDQNEMLKTENAQDVKRASKFKEKKKYECAMCMRKYHKKSSLVLHLKTHRVSKKHVCDRCNKEFNYEAHLNNHIINVHNHEKIYICDYCKKRFDSQGSLNAHKIIHGIKKKHKCNFCNKSFGMLCSLKDHIRTHTGERPFLCNICGKGFSYRNNLAQHIRRHQGLKPFHCSVCIGSFVSKGELQAHSRSHSGLHPFACSTCGGAFTTSSALVKHTRIHTKERPYHCTHCDRSFAASSTLANHTRTHTNERPYHCSHCDKAFIQRTDLVSHIRCHTGEKPYRCGCGQSFRINSSLKTHKKNCKETENLT